MPVREQPDAPILIAGGGIGGLAAALALQQRGFHAVVLERAPDLHEVGAGLLLSPNAVQVLKLLGIANDVAAHSRLINEWRILDRDGKALHRLHPARSGRCPAFSLHRAHLQRLLRCRLEPAHVRLDVEIVGFSETLTRVEVETRSGERLGGSGLIGADGLRSCVRRVGRHRDDLRDCGYSGWRSVVSFIPAGYEGASLTESWGEGKRFGISPLGDGRCYWYATANHARKPSGTMSNKDTLLSLFSHWHAPIPQLIASTDTDSILLNPILDRPVRMGVPDASRVTLLGDAAHPTTPNLGQGACLALEDAWVLAREIALAPTLIAGLRSYEALRSFRSKWISAASHALGRVIQLERPAATRLRDRVLRSTPEFLSDLTLRPLFSFQG